MSRSACLLAALLAAHLAVAPATAASFAAAAGRDEARASCREQTRPVMGTAATVRVCGAEPERLESAAAAALDEIERVDGLLSHYRPDSALSRLNRAAAAGPVPVDAELFAFLETCLQWSRESDGAFDVTVGPLMKAWGFFHDEGRVPEPSELRAALAAVGHRHVRLDRATRSVRFAREGVEIDPGGIGKGYAVDRAVSGLRGAGITSALVSLGGSSVYGLGVAPDGEGWRVGIGDPLKPAREAVTVRLRDRALSVSGVATRSFEKGGVRYAHIMDPRTGRPVAGVLGVAVLSESAIDGDALDDVLFVQGLDEGRRFVARRRTPTEAFVFVPSGDGYRLERLARGASSEGSRRRAGCFTGR